MEKPLEKWTVNELKAELKKRDLSTNGLKAELIGRLQEAINEDISKSGTEKAEEHVHQNQYAPGSIPDDEMVDNTSSITEHETPVVDKANAPLEQRAQTQGDEIAAAVSESQNTDDGKTAVAVEEVDMGPEEWEEMSLPEEWLPLPIVRVRNLTAECTSDMLEKAVQACGLAVKSISFELDKKDNKQTAFVRFPPLPLPWIISEEDLAIPVLGPDAIAAAKKNADSAKKLDTMSEVSTEVETDKHIKQDLKGSEIGEGAGRGEQPDLNGHQSTSEAVQEGAHVTKVAGLKHAEDKRSEETSTSALKPAVPASATVGKKALDDGRRDGDAAKMSRFLASHLTDCKPEVCGTAPIFDAPLLPVTLFLGNLSHDEDERLRVDMEQHGTLERCFIMRNHAGVSKGYAFVEYSFPSAAISAKEQLEQRCRKLLSELHSKRSSLNTRQRIVQQGQHHGSATATSEGEASKSEDVVEAKLVADVASDHSVLSLEKTETGGGSEEGGVKLEEGAMKVEAGAEEVGVSKIETLKLDEGGETGVEAQVNQLNEEGKQPPISSGAVGDEEGLWKVMRAEVMLLRTPIALFSKTIYVSNLPQGFVDENELRSVFEGYGPLANVSIVKSPTGNSKGYGFVEFKRSHHAQDALVALKNQTLPAGLGTLILSLQNPSKALAARHFSSAVPRGGPAGGRSNYSTARGRYHSGRGMPVYARGGYMASPARGAYHLGVHDQRMAFGGGYGGGRGSIGRGGYGVAGFVAQRGGYGVSQSGRYNGHDRAGGGYGSMPGSYAVERGQGYRGGAAAAAPGFQRPSGIYNPGTVSSYGVGGRGYGGTPGYGAVSTGYGYKTGYGASSAAAGGYGSVVPRTGYGAPSSSEYALPAQATGYGATGYGSLRAGQGYDIALKRTADHSYPGSQDSVYGFTHDPKRPRY